MVPPAVPLGNAEPLFFSFLFSSPSFTQVDNAKVLHYVGAGIAFPTSMLFVCLQSALTYRLAKTQGEYSVAHLRLCLTLLAFGALVLSILFSPNGSVQGCGVLGMERRAPFLVPSGASSPVSQHSELLS